MYAHVTGSQFVGQVGEYANFQIAPVGRWPLTGRTTNDLDPALRRKRQVDVLVDPHAVQILAVLYQLKCLNQRPILSRGLQLEKVAETEQQRAMGPEMLPDQRQVVITAGSLDFGTGFA